MFGLCPRFGLSPNHVGQRPNRGTAPKYLLQPPAWQSHASHQAAKPQRGCQIHNCAAAPLWLDSMRAGNNARCAAASPPDVRQGYALPSAIFF
jgi:hypothetical protein